MKKKRMMKRTIRVSYMMHAPGEGSLIAVYPYSTCRVDYLGLERKQLQSATSSVDTTKQIVLFWMVAQAQETVVGVNLALALAVLN